MQAAKLVELAKRYYSTVDNDPETVPELFTADAVYKRGGYPAFVGHDALVEFYSGDRTIAEGKHTLNFVTTDDDSNYAITEGEFNGVLKDGSTVHVPFADSFVFTSDGLIKLRKTYFDAAAV